MLKNRLAFGTVLLGSALALLAPLTAAAHDRDDDDFYRHDNYRQDSRHMRDRGEYNEHRNAREYREHRDRRDYRDSYDNRGNDGYGYTQSYTEGAGASYDGYSQPWSGNGARTSNVYSNHGRR